MDLTNPDRAVSKYFFSEDNFTMMIELLSDVSWKKYSIRLTKDINVLVLDIMKATFDNRPSVREGSARSDYILLLNKLVLVRCMDVIRDELDESRLKSDEGELVETESLGPTTAEERSLKSGVSAKYNDLLKARQDDSTMKVSVDPNQAAAVTGVRANFVIPKETDSNVLPSMIVDKDNDTVQRYEEIMKSREEQPIVQKRPNKYPSTLSPIPECDEESESIDIEATVLYHMDSGTEDYVTISNVQSPEDSLRQRPLSEGKLANSSPPPFLANQNDNDEAKTQPPIETRQSNVSKDYNPERDFEQNLTDLLSTRDRDIGTLNFPKPTEEAIRQLQNTSLSNQQGGRLNSFWDVSDKNAALSTSSAPLVESAPRQLMSNDNSAVMSSLQHTQTQMLEKIDAMTKNLENKLSQSLDLMTRLVEHVDKESSAVSSALAGGRLASHDDGQAAEKNPGRTTAANASSNEQTDTERPMRLITSLFRKRTTETVFDFTCRLDSSVKGISIKMLVLPLPKNIMPVLSVTFNDRSFILDRLTADKDHISCYVPTNHVHTENGCISVSVRDPFGASLATVDDVCLPTSVQSTGSTYAIETQLHHGLRSGERVMFRDLGTDDEDLTEWFADITGHQVSVIDALHFSIDRNTCSAEHGLVTALGTIIKPKAQTLITYTECV